MEIAAITHDQLRAALTYHPDTGVFTWNDPAPRGVMAGAMAGTTDGDGYIRISTRGRRYAAHRLAVLYMTGEWPAGEVDHINGGRTDNRWQNLRVGSRAFNGQNLRSARADSSTKVHGVERLPSGRFRARIGINGRMTSIGTFCTAEEAHAAFVARKREVHPGCAI